MNFLEGEVLYFDKPLYWTSFKLVKIVRTRISRKLKIKKIKSGTPELLIRWLQE